MPVAIGMPGTSPISPRMTKAQFFRARSPPIPDRQGDDNRPNIQSRLDQAAGPSRRSPSRATNQEEGGLEIPSRMDRQGSGDGTTGHDGYDGRTNLRIDTTKNNGYAPHTPTSPEIVINGLQNAQASSSRSPNDHYDTEELGDRSEDMVPGGSDEMLMTLLAGQAAVDCEGLQVGAWEEVESWKKELSLLSTRLSSLVARHQREVKILTAARTLQKLNHQNKRMSKQTTESLEQSEKRVEAAEKEVLLLRDRESSLRRQLMEHWSGVMSWEVRRLEKVSAETQARYHRQAKSAAGVKEREASFTNHIEHLEGEMVKRSRRVTELEEMVVELGRRERAMEEDVRQMDLKRGDFDKERDNWKSQLQRYEKERSIWEAERRSWEKEREGWEQEKRALSEERDKISRDREKVIQEGTGSKADRAVIEDMKNRVGRILAKRSPIADTEVGTTLDQVAQMIQKKEKEISNLRDEMKEVNQGLEEEVRRVAEDRDGWKVKAEKAETTSRQERAALERQTRNLSEQMSDLTLRNESLSTSLNAAQTALADAKTTSSSSKVLQNRVESLTAELDSIAGQFNEVWSILPPPSRRIEANLASPKGASTNALASPTQPVNFVALQALYVPNGESFRGIDEMITRIRGMVDDGKVLVERLTRMDRDREVYKSNAAKAKKLVEDSRHSLETYQHQVAVLEDRLAKSGATESHFLEELNTLRTALDAASIAKRNLEKQVSQQSDKCDRLQQSNDTLSAQALEFADQAEREKKALATKLQADIDAVKKQMADVEDGADEERSRGQAQRIQLLDELNSLQAEVGELRKQLRMARGGTPAK